MTTWEYYKCFSRYQTHFHDPIRGTCINGAVSFTSDLERWWRKSSLQSFLRSFFPFQLTGARCTSVTFTSRTPAPIPASPATRRVWTRTSPLYSWRTPLGKRVCISHDVLSIPPYDGTSLPVSLHYSSDWTLIVYKLQITSDNNSTRRR